MTDSNRKGSDVVAKPSSNSTMPYRTLIALFFVMVCSIVLSIYISLSRDVIENHTLIYRYNQEVNGETVSKTKEFCIRFSGNKYTLDEAVRKFLQLQPVHDGIVSTIAGCKLGFPTPHNISIVSNSDALDYDMLNSDPSDRKTQVQFIK